MTTKELMLGDIVTFKDSLTDNEIVPIKIVAIGYQGIGKEDEVLASINGDKTCDIIEIDDEIVGIPITPEILEKNGFKEISCGTSYVYGLTDDYYAIAIDELSDSIWRVEYFNREFNLPLCRNTVLFVHELQHALRLCGINKEIEI
jgi:hypothetical protein